MATRRPSVTIVARVALCGSNVSLVQAAMSEENPCYLCPDPACTGTTRPFFNHPDLKEIYMHATCFCAFAAWHETQENLRQTLLVWHREVVLPSKHCNVLALEVVRQWQRVKRCKWICTLRLQHLCRPLLLRWQHFAREAMGGNSSSSSEDSPPALVDSSSCDSMSSLPALVSPSSSDSDGLLL